MHRDFLAEHVVAPGHVDQHANPRAVNVRRDPPLRLAARKAPDRNVLADLLHERHAPRFDGVTRRERHAPTARDSPQDSARATMLRDLGGERLEVVVLRDEIGFAIDFDDRRDLRVVRDVESDHALGGDAVGRLARLRSALDPQQLLGLAEVAVGFGQRLLAFHHAEPGALAQVHHHACGNVRHVFCSDRWPGALTRLRYGNKGAIEAPDH